MDAFNNAVRGSVDINVAYGGGVEGYFRHTLTNCNPTNSPLCSGSSYNGQPGVFEVGVDN
jgi:hypothetical protein